MSIITIIVALLSNGPAEGLRATAPDLLTLEASGEHVFAATIGAVVADVDRDLLLSLAWFESRYQAEAQNPDGGHGRVSCGVMTPTPVARCPEAMTVLGGYLAGALHLREWKRACRGDERCMVLGYAGGFRVLGACRRGERVELRGEDACVSVPRARLGRARAIGRAIERAVAASRSVG